MLYNLILVLHVVSCIALIGVILIQRGRGAGLVEALAGAESLFGTKTSDYLVRATTVLAVLFFVFSLSLAVLSKQRSGSIAGQLAVSEETEEVADNSDITAESETAQDTSSPQETADNESGV